MKREFPWQNGFVRYLFELNISVLKITYLSKLSRPALSDGMDHLTALQNWGFSLLHWLPKNKCGEIRAPHRLLGSNWISTWHAWGPLWRSPFLLPANMTEVLEQPKPSLITTGTPNCQQDKPVLFLQIIPPFPRVKCFPQANSWGQDPMIICTCWKFPRTIQTADLRETQLAKQLCKSQFAW